MKSLYAIVGMQFRDAVDFVRALPNGEVLTLVREPANDFDCNAIQVWARGRHIGFVKANQARGLALAMDAHGHPPKLPSFLDGYSLAGKLSVSDGRWPMVEVES